MNFQSFSRQYVPLALICLVFFILGILRLNDLSIYTPDSARYLIIGNSLAHGKGFVDDTLPEPDRFVVQGPLYPILLIPIQIFFPLSLEAGKIWTLLWGLLAVILFYHWISRITNSTLALVATLFFASNPLMLVYSGEVLSEAPFIVFVFLILILADRTLNSNTNEKKKFIFFIVPLIAVVLLREIGIALYLAALLYLFSKKEFKKISILLLTIGGILLLWYLRNYYWIEPRPPSLMSNYSLVLQHVVTAPDTPLINEFALRIWINLKTSFMQIGGMLLYPLYLAQQFKLGLMPSEFHLMLTSFFTTFGKFVVLIFTLPLIGYGIVLDFRNSSTALLRILFGAIYYGLLMVYPVLDIRFLLLFLPLILYYIVRALNTILGEWEPLEFFKRKGVVYFTAIILLIPNFSGIAEILKLNLSYRKSPVGFFEKYGQKPQCPVMFTQPWSLLGEWIDENLPEDVIIASPAKNIATFVGSRKVLEIDQGTVEPVFEMLLRDNIVDYILSPSRGQDLKIYHFLMLESKRFWFEPVYHVANLYLYKVHSRLRESHGDVSLFSSDTLSASYMLEKGRVELLNGNYATAHRWLRSALSFNSTHPALLYQMVLYYTLTNDSIRVKHYYNKLYSLPQALGFVLPARLQLQALERLNYARSQTNSESRAVETYNAASMYWKMGYYNRAAQIMNELIAVDSSYFVGMLWGLHYNMYIGDTIIPGKYLSALKRIDSSNTVVQVFDKMFVIKDTLRSTIDRAERSRMHVAVGELYKQIEMNEESLDEAEFALKENSTNADAWLLMAQIFERKSNFRMASKAYAEVALLQPNNMQVQAKINSINTVLARR